MKFVNVLLFIIMSCFPFWGSAQFSTGLSLSGGANFVKMSELGGDEFSEFLPGLTYKTGVLLRKDFSDKLSVEIEPAFMAREVRWLLDFSDGTHSIKSTQRYRHNYVSIPANVNFLVIRGLYLECGVVNNIFINDKTINDSQTGIENDYNVKSNNYNMAFSIGAEYMAFDKLLLKLHYEIDFLDSYKSINKQLYSIYYTNHSVFFSVAYILFTTNDEE